MRFLRSLLAIAAGFGVFGAVVILTRGDGNPADLGFMLLNIAWIVMAALLGGYLTALIAGAHEFPHAATVGLLMVVASFVSVLRADTFRPGWYQMAVAGCGPVSAMLGAAVRVLTKDRLTKASN